MTTAAPRLNSADCAVVVHCYPTNHADHRLMRWLCEFGVPWEQMAFGCVLGIPQAYNQGVRKALDSGKSHLIFADHDVIPVGRTTAHPATDTFLDACEADIVCCPCRLDIPGEWADPNTFHCGLWRITRDALLKISPPWFQFTYNGDGTELRQCVCAYFAEKARAAGLNIVRQGWADHKVKT